jgi:hypothetical protein
VDSRGKEAGFGYISMGIQDIKENTKRKVQICLLFDAPHMSEVRL